ncbi:uncharacterized protein BX663DRAFT_526478 [Cokeromyces recurvatus]|uniref:uncharacterized protein n=1 Tax=Cokeromyces recurvatus TaxID=90255 RepID=UPI00221F2A79|nr:uncharacterized protein BX663DRAFT_526478 [Cokeromyces recurvatus]KAI7897928.1 hypothetical protein BX663DRAFT_526478 [Cokeromyces recurvatus]
MLKNLSIIVRRTYTSLNRPGPIPLGNKKQQKEMLDLIRKKQLEDVNSTNEMHNDVIQKPKPEFEGDVNPKTGEVNGPKTEPVKHNDWSFGGRVTDF